MTQDRTRIRKTYSFFRPPPILASGGGGGGGGGGCCTPELWFSTTDDAIYTTGSVLIRGADATDAAQDYGTDTWFFVSGSISGNGSERKVSTFGGDVVVSGSLTALNGLSGSLTQLPDGTSYLIAGVGIDIVSASNGAVTISALIGGGDVYTDDFVDGDLTLSNILVVNHGLTAQYVNVSVYDENDKLIIPDEVIASSPGTVEVDLTSFRTLPGTWHVFVASGQAPNYDQYWFSTTADSIFTTGSAAFVGNELGIDSPFDKGADVFFYVSGSSGSMGTSVPGVALFGGDVRISGSLKIGTGSVIITSNNLQFTDYDMRLERDGSDLMFYDVNYPSGLSLTDLFTNSGTPGSPVNSVQYNSAGTFVGSADLTYDSRLRLTGSFEQGRLTLASGDYSHAEGYLTTASAARSHAEGYITHADGGHSHAEGARTKTDAAGAYSHVEGYYTTASAFFAHAEGERSRAEGVASHAEGLYTLAAGDYSHAEGYFTEGTNDYSHAEGSYTLASGEGSHAEGEATKAQGNYSHTEGYLTTASAAHSHAGGWGTRAAAQYQTTIGHWNAVDADSNTYFIIGNGTSNSSRSDVFKVSSAGITVNEPAEFNSTAQFDGTTTFDATIFNDLATHNYVMRLDQGSTAMGTAFVDAGVFWECDIVSFGTQIRRWGIGINSTSNLQFIYGTSTSPTAPAAGTTKGFVDSSGTNIAFNFTGQHRCTPASGFVLPLNNVGLIVRSTGVISPISGSYMTINDAVPVVDLTSQRNDKRSFGVVSDMEDNTDGTRKFSAGVFVSVYEADPNDNRVYVNSLGEGCIWVSNINGNLENGDYITTCEIPGHGMRQDDDLLHNYTVAKITMDCDFDLGSTLYRCEEFEHEGVTYRRAFVGCTYHCG